MICSRDIDESYKRLKEALENILEGRGTKLVISQADDYPLLVLETSHDLVGFAVVNSTAESAFASAYDSFKHLYRHEHNIWKDRNLSFVVCRSDSEPTYDAFFSSIETDAYFCRKYVVYFRNDQDGLVRELLRLPFLPIPEGRAGGVLRPPAAQTLLQRLNVSAQLARQIIVPLEYSASRIVDQLLAEKVSLPVIGISDVPDIQHQIQPKERTRIRNVTIEAFRAYRKKQDFDVDADVVVLYGPNGLGKTSFFDAIDYACTGRIGRICRHRISQDEFMDIACHLGSSASDGHVSMQLRQGTTDYSFRRSVAEWGAAVIGTENCDRASALQFLASSHWEPKKARIENLERLFRATHFFGQSDPELLVEFEQDSTLSPDLVHRMLALDDYASGLAKATSILAELDKRITESKQQISFLSTNLDKVQSQIKGLPTPQDTEMAGKYLRDMMASLIKDLQLYINVSIDDVEPSQASAHEWRAIAESALKDIQDRHRLLQSIESGFAKFDENRSTLKRSTAELSKLEIVLSENNVEHRRHQEEKKKLTDRLEQERIDLAQIKLRLSALAELSGFQEVFQKTISSLQKWQMELKRVVAETDATTTELQQLLPGTESLRARTAELRQALKVKSQQLQTLSTIQDGISSWEKNRVDITNLQQATERALSTIQEISEAIDKLNIVIATQEKESRSCEQEYGDLTANQLKLTSLLDEIEAHVENGICPTCGIDHKSKAALIEKIHAQKQTRPTYVDTLAKRSGELRKALQKNRATHENLTHEHTSKKRELEEIASKLTEMRESAGVFESAVAEAGLTLDRQPAATIAHKLIEEKNAIELSQKTLAKLETELTSPTKRMNEIEQKLGQLEDARKRTSAAIMPLEQQISAMRSKAEASGLSLEMTPEEYAAESSELNTRKAGAEERIHKLTLQIEAITQTATKVEKQISEVTEKVKFLRQEIERLEASLRSYEENAASVIHRNALSMNEISEQRRLAAERVDRLDAVTKHCIRFERTVDATQRSALLAELEAQAQSMEKQKQTLVGAAERISAVKKWFTSVKGALDRQSSSTVADHVDAFGPLTTLIQKRLRAVYGFGDVSLLAEGNTIRVVVGWETKYVKPADYFSDSQKQILMLSIFLASRLTQTWSGFAPVLMDDPVTHFDDLNAFGFVELIRGFVSNSPGKRQFFISTCEDRLFELMLKKFNNVEGGAKFYRFEGIGRDGPLIRETRY